MLKKIRMEFVRYGKLICALQRTDVFAIENKFVRYCVRMCSLQRTHTFRMQCCMYMYNTSISFLPNEHFCLLQRIYMNANANATIILSIFSATTAQLSFLRIFTSDRVICWLVELYRYKSIGRRSRITFKSLNCNAVS